MSFGDDTLSPEDGEVTRLKTEVAQLREENERIQRLLNQCEQDFQAIGKHADAIDAEADNWKAKHDALLTVVKQYNAAAEKFINKVDSGRARSVETHKELKDCLRAAYLLLDQDQEG